MTSSGPRGITVGAGGILLRDDRILLVRLTYGFSKDMWTIPGGFQEPGESLAETAERELLEETGVRGRATRLVAIRSLATADRSDTYFAFSMEDMGGDPKADGEEVQEVAFKSVAWTLGAPEVPSFTKMVLARALEKMGMELTDYKPQPPRPGVLQYDLYSTPEGTRE